MTPQNQAQYPPYSPFHSAQLLLSQHGSSAAVYAMKEMANCQASGDGAGYAEWGCIFDAIEELAGPE